ncbi:polyketide-type polyunsaturated fatty acid synthase PfaA [Mucilaginibacter pineti]|uniref:Polyketide-type polyunsaturated fatty acid synthase PfaA n=1 Tax=Mucilaginibacter pineti TaxID=1391627 RepID=A0A1G7NYE9_9SPHI|nr:type I polyketide synthase [Mucilaginibacter pineti]SDF79065.1 polyketide-type polyunsaturated fatty acid synthase PfaA [Mucilaginibacter pineti]
MTEKSATRNKSGHHKIAIVGTGALFPGALTSKEFWLNVLAERDFIRDVPVTHWLKEDYYDPDDKSGDKVNCKRGAFLDDVPFDPVEFGMPPNMLSTTDTVQLLSLIVARDVLADTLSFQNGKTDPKNVGVILGVAGGTELIGQMSARIRRPEWTKVMREQGLPESQVQEICDGIAASYTNWNENTFPGLLGNVVSGRVANRFNLNGTNCVIDAACASSLGAIKMAVQELQLETTDMVISGGADALNDIFMYMCFSKTTALSPTEDCRPFSASADGTVLGEGVAMLALKRLEDAERDGDKIYAIITSIGSSSDGKSKSIYAPDSNGQSIGIGRAYMQAGFAVNEIELIEGHGTGTMAGDAAEFAGLKLAYGETATKQYCALGSVKSQIGHTKSAAGAVSVLKTAMALSNAIFPPTIKVDRPNPAMEMASSPFYLNTVARPWIHEPGTSRKAAVSSMGFGGTNFHVAMEEYLPVTNRTKKVYRAGKELFTLSAPSVPELISRLKMLNLEINKVNFVETALKTQQAFKHTAICRLSLLATDSDVLTKYISQAIEMLGQDQEKFDVAGIMYYSQKVPVTKVAFLAAGQGSQYLNMGTDLLMQYDAAMQPWNLASAISLEPEKKLNQVVYPIPVFNEVDLMGQKKAIIDTRWAQPAIGTLALSHLALLNGLGVKADCAGGHSYGEIVALYAAGVIENAQDMILISRLRGELMADSSTEDGAMTAIFCGADAIRALIIETASPVVIANLNSPSQTVIGGTAQEVAFFEIKLADAGHKFQRLGVSTAFHSRLVAPATGKFEAALQQYKFKQPAIPVYSNTTADLYPVAAKEIIKTLARQLAHPVEFTQQVTNMYDSGAQLFLEIGPGKVLSSFVKQILSDKPHTAIAMDGGARENSKDAFWNALAQLSAAGVACNFDSLWRGVDIQIKHPEIRKASVATVRINGSNLNKPYPPKAGYSSLPAPNPERPVTQSIVPVIKMENQSPTKPMPVAAPVGQTGNTLIPEQKNSIPCNQIQHNRKMTEADNQWIHAFQEIQKNMLTAQQSFQDTLAQNHQLFLQTSQIAFEQLGRLAGNQPSIQQVTTSSPQPPQPVTTPRSAPMPAYQQPPEQVVTSQPFQATAPTSQVAEATQAAHVNVIAPANTEMDFEDTLLTIVAEHTGYPKEILDLDTDMESGLGIDSIKRVQILAAIQEVFPSLKKAETAKLAAMHTLAEILVYAREGAPQLPVAVVAPVVQIKESAIPADFEDHMLQIVADKTGYPKEILDIHTDLESGLGIDSIKRVEILAALREKFAALKNADTARLAKMNTLAEILAYANAEGVTTAELKKKSLN